MNVIRWVYFRPVYFYDFAVVSTDFRVKLRNTDRHRKTTDPPITKKKSKKKSQIDAEWRGYRDF